MMDSAPWLVLGLSITCAVIVVIKALRLRRKALTQLEQLQWIEGQYSKALRCLRSNERQQMLTGLQLISAFNDSDACIRVLPEISKLVDHSDPVVARLARNVLTKITSELSGDLAPAEMTSGSGGPSTPTGAGG
jgi:hypothetical protein